jgi:outer membrane scaffolding protein for murein synthesis (MipA/OmpV family)
MTPAGRRKFGSGRGALGLALLASSFGACAGASPPLWEIGVGAGALSFPPYVGSTHRNDYLAPLPYVVYRGERLRADRSGVRGLLFDTERLSLRLSLSGSPPPDDGDDAARDGMPGLDPLAELGPELRWHAWQSDAGNARLDLRLPLRAAYAVSSDGIEAVGAVTNPALDLELQDLPAAGWRIGLNAGPVFASNDYHQYYYAVEPRFATARRPAYAAHGGFGGTQWTASITRRSKQLWLGAFLRGQSLHGARIEDSPLVHAHSGLSAGVGFAWIFARSTRAAASTTDDT